MIEGVTGLHHVTTLARDAAAVDTFCTRALGLRRVKRTVDPEAPDSHRLYYGDGSGTPGTVVACAAYPALRRARRGVGEMGHVAHAVPRGALDDWARRYRGARRDTAFGEARLHLTGPDGEAVLLVESDAGRGAPWPGAIDAAIAPRGLHSVSLRVAQDEETDALLRFLGYTAINREGRVSRYSLAADPGAALLDLDRRPDMPRAIPGAGAVHHVALAVPDLGALESARGGLEEAGYAVTSVLDRQYFHAIHFRGPEGIFFCLATEAPGFAADEPMESLGEALCLPPQHEPSRGRIDAGLPPL